LHLPVGIGVMLIVCSIVLAVFSRRSKNRSRF